MIKNTRLLVVSPTLELGRAFQNELLSAGIVTLVVRNLHHTGLVRAFRPHAAILDPAIDPLALPDDIRAPLADVALASTGRRGAKNIGNCGALDWPLDAAAVRSWLECSQTSAPDSRDFADGLLDFIALGFEFADNLAVNFELRSSLNSARIVGYDAVPSLHVCRGVPHNAILRAVERSHLEDEYCTFLIDMALTLWRQLHVAGRAAPIGVRLPASALLHTRLPSTIDSQTLAAGAPIGAIRVDVNLPSSLENARICLDALKPLRRAGIRTGVVIGDSAAIAIEWLRRAGIEEARFDSIELRRAEGKAFSRIVHLQDIAAIKRAGLACTAEGIGSECDLETCLSLGIEIGQGRHWGYPMPMEVIV
ncbi:EAL domain-containing protein [Sphingomonas cavernae]|uniref:EAL domain-containing protein n=1 Tax=Sphingomonas cavernae TaxID=2320861 RepID=UPI001EE54DB2|nr:EAL domain-containing protein [Sphingomonas cavernae]